MSRDYDRRTNGDLAYGDDFQPGQRWDRSRFERERAKGRPPTFDYPPAPSRPSDDLYADRYPDNDYYSRRQSRPAFLDRGYDDTAGREVTSTTKRVEIDRSSSRPGFARRQSSWDAHDRRPLPRYGGRDAEVDVDIRINRDETPAPEPPRRYYYPEEQDEDYRDVRIVRERERSVYRRDQSRHRYQSSESEEISEEEVVKEKPKKERKPKRGRTKMPKRLVHKRAIIDLGYPFEEEEHFFIVFVAMKKEQIDQAIKISETYKIVYKDDDTPKQIEAPPSREHSPPSEERESEVVETITTKIIENPTDSDYERYGQSKQDGSRSPSPSRSSAHSRSKSSRGRSRSERNTTFTETEEDETDVKYSSTLTVPDRSRRSERDIKAEIKRLEAEKRALRHERERSHHGSDRREVDFEVSERSDKEVLRIEKDGRGRLSLVRPSR